MKTHVCDNIKEFPLDKLYQKGTGLGKKVLILGESPAPNGWIISGKACYKPDGKILPTGKRLNELLKPMELSVEICGFTEICKCFVSKRTELESCSKKCWPILIRQIENNDYNLLVVLGVKTTEILSKIIQKKLTMGSIQDIEINNKKYKILPIFHPSPINPTGHSKNIDVFTKLQDNIKAIIHG
jgi:uracil-DNA glycosylase family 4